MKKLNFLVSALLLASLTVQAQEPLRLMTYNIKNGLGMDNVCSYQRIADAIKKAAPDVVALQEVDSVTNRSNHKYVLGEIAKLTDMSAYFAPAIDFDGGKYGIGLLAKRTPIRVERIALPGREEARAMILVEFDTYIYCCTHLSLTEEDRMASLPLLRKFAKGTNKPFFLAGDFNATPESDFIKTLKKDFIVLSDMSQHTFPSPAPDETIDYIVARNLDNYEVNVKKTCVLEEPVASDHRPILVEVTIKKK